MQHIKAVKFEIFGIVQGVGFRPFISRLAREHGIAGHVCNRGSYVEIVAGGEAAHIEAFQENITKAIENLVPKGGSEPGQTINTAALEQKISEAQARITNSNYTEASIQEVTKVINEAQAYIQGVKNGSEKTDKVQSYINNLNEKLAGLVENQVESVKGNLDASFTQPNGTPSMMEAWLRASEMMASSCVRKLPKSPPLASKQAA